MRLMILVGLLSIATAAQAQPTSPWRTALQGGAVHQFETGLDGGGDVAVNRAFIQGGIAYAFDNRSSLGAAVAYGFDGYDFSGTTGLAGLDPWGSVSEYRLSAPIRWGFGERLDAVAVPSLRWTAETDADLGEGFNPGAIAGFTWRFSDRLRLGPGIGVFSEIEDDASIIPIIFVDWQITDTLSLDTGSGLGATRGPGLSINWTGLENWTFSFSGRYETYRFRLDDEGTAPDGVGEEEALPLYLSAAYDPLPFVRLGAVAGVDVAGSMTLEDENGDEIRSEDFDPTPFVGLTFRARF